MNKLPLFLILIILPCLSAYSQDAAKKDLVEGQNSAAATSSKRISSTYNEAVSLYAKKRYQEALTRFTLVDSFESGYKQTDFYLEAIPRLIEENKQNKVSEKSKRKQLSALYKKAVRLYKNKLLEDSLRTFTFIETNEPGYAKSAYYIKKINKELKAAAENFEIREKTINSLYSDAVDLYKRKQYEESLFLFSQINDRSPGYSDTPAYIEKISAIMQKKVDRLGQQLQEKRKNDIRGFLIEFEKKNPSGSFHEE